MKTEIIKISTLDAEGDKKLKYAAEKIKSAGLVAFPTETVYGLGANGLDADAAKKIYSAKGRPSDNPLILHISRPEEAEKLAYTGEVYCKLAQRFMPGPITVVLPAKDIVPKETRASLPTVAVRCPENPIARRLIELSQTPIAAPSANLSGSPSPTKASHVIDDLMGRVDIIIDGADAEFGLESTIVKIDSDGGLTLLRPGKITIDELREISSDVRIADAVTEELKKDEVALSPGMKYRHYAPKAEVYLLDGIRDTCVDYIEGVAAKKRVALICYNADTEYFEKRLPNVHIYEFGEKEDQLAQAHALFDILRDADKHDFDVIYAPVPQKSGVGLALYNRMIRAAAHHIIRM